MGIRPLKLPGLVGAFHGSQLESNPISPLLASSLILHRIEPIHVDDHPVLGHEPDVLCQVLEGIQLDGITLSTASSITLHVGRPDWESKSIFNAT